LSEAFKRCINPDRESIMPPVTVAARGQEERMAMRRAHNSGAIGSKGRYAIRGAWMGFFVDMFDIYLPIIVLAPAIAYLYIRYECVHNRYRERFDLRGDTDREAIGAAIFRAYRGHCGQKARNHPCPDGLRGGDIPHSIAARV
jgi:hypothetical protein